MPHVPSRSCHSVIRPQSLFSHTCRGPSGSAAQFPRPLRRPCPVRPRRFRPAAHTTLPRRHTLRACSVPQHDCFFPARPILSWCTKTWTWIPCRRAGSVGQHFAHIHMYCSAVLRRSPLVLASLCCRTRACRTQNCPAERRSSDDLAVADYSLLKPGPGRNCARRAGRASDMDHRFRKRFWWHFYDLFCKSHK